MSSLGESPILVQGASLEKFESVFKTNTLEGTRVLYSFGSQMGNVTVALQLLLGEYKGTSDAWRNLLAYYKANNVSTTKKPIKLSMPGNTSCEFFLVGMRMSPPDPNFNIAQASLTGIIVE